MKLTVPPSTQVLLIVAIFTAFLVFTGEIPGYLTLAAIAYLGIKLHARYSNWCDNLDHPPPKLYDLSAPAVWAQVDEALKTLKSTSKNINISIDYSNPEPPPGQPIFVQATITIHHPHLKEWGVDKHLSAANQDLRSKVTFKAYIEQKQEKSELRVECDTQPILTRFLENNAIQTILNKIDELVNKHLPKP